MNNGRIGWIYTDKVSVLFNELRKKCSWSWSARRARRAESEKCRKLKDTEMKVKFWVEGWIQLELSDDAFYYYHWVSWPGLVWSDMARCDRGIQLLLTTFGAFVAFSLMTVAIGTDYWLYSRAYICNATNISADETQIRKTKGDLTHSGLWRICCIEGKTVCFLHISVIKLLFGNKKAICIVSYAAKLYSSQQWLWIELFYLIVLYLTRNK